MSLLIIAQELMFKIFPHCHINLSDNLKLSSPLSMHTNFTDCNMLSKSNILICSYFNFSHNAQVHMYCDLTPSYECNVRLTWKHYSFTWSD